MGEKVLGRRKIAFEMKRELVIGAEVYYSVDSAVDFLMERLKLTKQEALTYFKELDVCDLIDFVPEATVFLFLI